MDGPLRAEDEARLRRRLAALPRVVRLVFFGQRHPCPHCREQAALLEALARLSPRLRLETHHLETATELARRLGIDKVPALALLDEDGADPGIRFFGLTAGFELESLLAAIEMVAHGRAELAPTLQEWLQAIDRPVHLEVLVTLTCPYCPRMVQLAHRLAMASPHIRADMIDVAEFPQLAQRYEVSGVPLTVVDGRPLFEGALPPEDALLEILRVVAPARYEALERRRRQAAGDDLTRPVSPDRRYDLLIVGAGPAALTAALYAVRKGLDTALVGDRPGGQINDTARIENWPGIPAIGGQELAEAFRTHLERYPVAERMHARISRLERDETGFVAYTEDGLRLRARAVLVATGKRHRTLGVPGERRFLGRGIGFCATCDAPLYRDKTVAVVGGGNSAFTAVRDLLPFARRIHLIHIGEDFQADPVLVEEVMKAPQVVIHRRRQVRAFLGKTHLVGVRLQEVDGTAAEDLKVDGVFVEIGLEPNSALVRGLVALNAAGEIPVDRHGATALPGLFAAGDVTDEPEKQIVVAAGAGAKAALAAHRHLQAVRRDGQEKTRGR